MKKPEITKEQEQIFFDNYMKITEREISELMNITFNQYKYFVLKVSVETMRERCATFLAKPIYNEVFEEVEADNLISEEDLIGRATMIGLYSGLAGKREEIINGKVCIVFQSRMNYEKN